MKLNGEFSQLDPNMLKALHQATQDSSEKGSNIDASEVQSIREAAAANGLSEGEEELIAQLEAATQDEVEIENFQIMNFDPSSPELDFVGHTLTINENEGVVFPDFEVTFQKDLEKNGFRSDDRIREMSRKPDQLAYLAEKSPESLLQALDVLTSGWYSGADREAVTRIFSALPAQEKAQVLEYFIQQDDDDTLRALSQDTQSLYAVARAGNHELFSSAQSVLDSGWVSSEDREAIARFSRMEQSAFFQDEAQPNDPVQAADRERYPQVTATQPMSRAEQRLATTAHQENRQIVHESIAQGNIPAEIQIGEQTVNTLDWAEQLLMHSGPLATDDLQNLLNNLGELSPADRKTTLETLYSRMERAPEAFSASLELLQESSFDLDAFQALSTSEPAAYHPEALAIEDAQALQEIQGFRHQLAQASSSILESHLIEGELSLEQEREVLGILLTPERLQENPQESFQAALGALESRDPASIVQALQTLSAVTQRDQLSTQSQHPQLRSELLHTLRPELTHPDPAVSQAALDLLVQWGNGESDAHFILTHTRELASLEQQTQIDAALQAQPYQDYRDTPENQQVQGLLDALKTGRVTETEAQQLESLFSDMQSWSPLEKEAALKVLASGFESIAVLEGEVDRVLNAVEIFNAASELDLQVDLGLMQRHKEATESTRQLDLTHRSSSRDYAQAIRHSESYFERNAESFQRQVEDIDQLIATERTQTPPDPVEIEKLTQLKALTEQLSTIQSRIQIASQSNRAGRQDDAAQVIEEVATARELLSQLNPEDLEVGAYAKMDALLNDYTQIAMAFPTLEGHPDASVKLNSFYLQVHQRVRQIEAGHRSRETPDVSGALESYRNDAQDISAFNQRFQSIQSDLAQGNFQSEAELSAAMQEAIPATSARFQSSVATLSQSLWHQYQSQLEATAAREKLTEAQSSIQQADTALLSGEDNLSEAARLSMQAMTQDNLEGALETLEKSETLRQEAQRDLEAYTEALASGEQSLAEVEPLRQKAEQALARSEQYAYLVESGPYAQHLSQSLSSVNSENQTIRTELDSIQTESTALGEEIESLSERATALEQDLVTMTNQIQFTEGELKFTDLKARAQAQVDQNLEQTTATIASHFAPYLDDLDSETRDYLNNPEGVTLDDRADVREDLQDLFEDQPELARTVAAEIMTLKGDFDSLRSELQTKLTRARSEDNQTQIEMFEHQLLSLDQLEVEMLNGWAAKQGVLIEALAAAASDDSTVAAKLQQFTDWTVGTQERQAQNLLRDPDIRQSAAEAFDQSLEGDDLPEHLQEIRDKIDKTAGDYGDLVHTVPMMIVSDGTGQTSSFNAYVYEDGDQFVALNPLTKELEWGNSPEAALENLTAKAKMGEGTIHYATPDGTMETARSEAPEGASWLDYTLGAAGLIGGVVLIVIPEPTTSAGGVAVVAASAAVFTSSAYFVGKGTVQLSELAHNDNIGWNKETGLATFDIATGLLGGLGALGTAGRGAAMASRTSQMTLAQRHLLTAASKLPGASMGTSRGLLAADLAAGVGDLSLVAYEAVNVYNNPNLSDGEKQRAIAQMTLMATTPFLLAGAIGRNRGNAIEMDQRFQKYDQMINETLNQNLDPEVQRGSKRALEESVNMMEYYYNSPAFDNHPTQRAAGLERVEALKARVAAMAEPTFEPPKNYESQRGAQTTDNVHAVDVEGLAQNTRDRNDRVTRADEHMATADGQTTHLAPENVLFGGKRTDADLEHLSSTRDQISAEFQTQNPDLNMTQADLDRKNIAYADYDIEGIDGPQQGSVKAFSGEGEMDGFAGIPEPSEQSLTHRLDILNNGRGVERGLDTEIKILEDLFARTTPESSGTVRLFSDIDVCPSCQRAITQFALDRPNIEIQIVTRKANNPNRAFQSRRDQPRYRPNQPNSDE